MIISFIPGFWDQYNKRGKVISSGEADYLSVLGDSIALQEKPPLDLQTTSKYRLLNFCRKNENKKPQP
jgi:hypothetical protein